MNTPGETGENGLYMEIGVRKTFVIVSVKDHGAYLGESRDAGPEDRVLLPARQVPEGAKPGDEVEAFIYRDSADRLIATTAEPKIRLHETADLVVRETTRIGAFLDWGLEKDLLLPFHEQTRRVSAGDSVLVALYVDKTGRLAATMKVYPYLSCESPYKKGDLVKGVVYQIADNFGAFVAVDHKYSGMIPKRENPHVAVGDEPELHVTGVKPDGKLDLSLRGKAYEQISPDAEAVLRIIENEYSGHLPFDDKADPDRIRDVYGISKAAFKRAVGHLYKMRKISISGGSITVTESDNR